MRPIPSSKAGSKPLPDNNSKRKPPKIVSGVDRHVLAAAIRCNADAIITFNLRDFPESNLEPFGLVAIHPDEFVANELDLHEAVVCEAVRIVRSRLKSPPKTVEAYLAALERQGLTQTVSDLRRFAALL